MKTTLQVLYRTRNGGAQLRHPYYCHPFHLDIVMQDAWNIVPPVMAIGN